MNNLHSPYGGGSPNYQNAAAIDFMRQHDPGVASAGGGPGGGGGPNAGYASGHGLSGRPQAPAPGMSPISPLRHRSTSLTPGVVPPSGPPGPVGPGHLDEDVGGTSRLNHGPSINPQHNRSRSGVNFPGPAGVYNGGGGTGPGPGMVGGPPLDIMVNSNGDGDLPPPPAAAATAGASSGPPPSGPSGEDMRENPSSFLPAPYRKMLSQTGQEDPTIARARSIMETHKKDNRRQAAQLPPPRAGIPSKPKALAVEPVLPNPRLGRRCILAQKQKRVPDLSVGTHFTSPAQLQQLQQQMQQGVVTVNCIVECASCGSTLQTKKAAVLTQCPVCHKVFQTASCLQHG